MKSPPGNGKAPLQAGPSGIDEVAGRIALRLDSVKRPVRRQYLPFVLVVILRALSGRNLSLIIFRERDVQSARIGGGYE